MRLQIYRIFGAFAVYRILMDLMISLMKNVFFLDTVKSSQSIIFLFFILDIIGLG